MADHEIEGQGSDSLLPGAGDHSASPYRQEGNPPARQRKRHHAGTGHEPEDPIALLSGNLLERADTFIYAIVGICFLLGALFALGYCVWDFSTSLHIARQPPDIAGAIIKLVSDLLLVLIIMEVLSTVIHYLKAHATSLRPFLFIGIVSATRGILSIGARLSVGQVSPQEFPNAMIELGVNAAVILALGITLKLLERHFEDRPS